MHAGNSLTTEIALNHSEIYILFPSGKTRFGWTRMIILVANTILKISIDNFVFNLIAICEMTAAIEFCENISLGEFGYHESFFFTITFWYHIRVFGKICTA